MLIRTPKEGAEYDTITLKWCTPRNLSSAEMHNCTTMHRITPTDVNRYLLNSFSSRLLELTNENYTLWISLEYCLVEEFGYYIIWSQFQSRKSQGPSSKFIKSQISSNSYSEIQLSLTSCWSSCRFDRALTTILKFFYSLFQPAFILSDQFSSKWAISDVRNATEDRRKSNLSSVNCAWRWNIYSYH